MSKTRREDKTMSEQWFAFKDQQQKGPFTWKQLWQQAAPER